MFKLILKYLLALVGALTMIIGVTAGVRALVPTPHFWVVLQALVLLVVGLIVLLIGLQLVVDDHTY